MNRTWSMSNRSCLLCPHTQCRPLGLRSTHLTVEIQRKTFKNRIFYYYIPNQGFHFRQKQTIILLGSVTSFDTSLQFRMWQIMPPCRNWKFYWVSEWRTIWLSSFVSNSCSECWISATFNSMSETWEKNYKKRLSTLSCYWKMRKIPVCYTTYYRTFMDRENTHATWVVI